MIRALCILAAVTLTGFGLPARAELQIQEVTSPGGIKAWLVEDHNIPFTALEIQFRGGTSLDAPGKRGPCSGWCRARASPWGTVR